IPVRRAGDRESGGHLATGTAWRGPAAAAALQGARLPQDLEHRAERIPAQDLYPRAGAEACSVAWAAQVPDRNRLGDALRQPVDRDAAARTPGARLRPHPGGAALSALFGCNHLTAQRR